jgi:hypothetical protein
MERRYIHMLFNMTFEAIRGDEEAIAIPAIDFWSAPSGAVQWFLHACAATLASTCAGVSADAL